jgi:hypothetical protein
MKKQKQQKNHGSTLCYDEDAMNISLGSKGTMII